jgi:hypothetical protein
MRQIIFLLLLPFLTTCNTSNETNSFKDEDIKFYTQKIESARLNQEKWAETPLLIVNELLSPQYRSEGNSYYNIEIVKVSIDTITIIVTEEGLLDDSVYGEKRVIHFVFRNNHWDIERIKVGFKCQKNRGHENYSGQGCS